MELTNEQILECLKKVKFKNDPYPYSGTATYECNTGEMGCDVEISRFTDSYHGLDFEVESVIFWDENGNEIEITEEQLNQCWEYLEYNFR